MKLLVQITDMDNPIKRNSYIDGNPIIDRQNKVIEIPDAIGLNELDIQFMGAYSSKIGRMIKNILLKKRGLYENKR